MMMSKSIIAKIGEKPRDLATCGVNYNKYAPSCTSVH